MMTMASRTWTSSSMATRHGKKAKAKKPVKAKAKKRAAPRRRAVVAQPPPAPVVAAPPPRPVDPADVPVPAPKAAWAASRKLCRFLVQLSHHGNVTRALRGAKLNRGYAYDRRTTDMEFAGAWEEAVKIGLQVLKDEAWRRAHDGVEKVKYYQGQKIGTEIEYSDTLLMFLIKQHDPSFREHFDLTLGNQGGRPFMFQMLLHPEAVKEHQGGKAPA